MTAMPAAPQPVVTTRMSSIRLSTTRSALSSAARTTIAVPCWSSWKTGMSSDSRSRRSISKQRGAEMSSRLMPPKTGAIGSTVRTISSASFVARQIGKASTSANSLNSTALPSITGQRGLGTDVAEPEHRGAVADDGDRVALDREVPDLLRIVRDRARDARDARRVDHREVFARLQRRARLDLELAAEVGEEDAVGDVDDLDSLDATGRPRRSPRGASRRRRGR